MLIKFKVKSRIAICYLHWFRIWSQQVLYVLLDKQGTTEDSHDLVNVSLKFHLMFDYCDNAVSAYSRIDLYSDRSLGVTPESGYPEMLFDPFEEKFHLPPVLVQVDNLFGGQEEIVGIKYKTSLQVRDICHDTSYSGRIIGCVASAGKPDSIVLKYISVLRHVHSVLYNEFWSRLLPYDKEGSQFLNLMQSFKIPVSAIEYVSGQRFIINDIHRIDIMDCSIGNIDHDWDLSHNIKLCVQFDSGFGASEPGPVIHAHAQINGRGIECIEFATDTEFSVYSRILGKHYHVVGELLEYTPVSMGVASGKYIAVHLILSESEMKRLLAVGSGDIGEFTETAASKKLTEHKDQQLSPIRQLPSEGFVLNLMFASRLHDSFKFAFWQKVNNLAENVSSCIHENSGNRILRLRPQYNHLKSATRFPALEIA